MWYFLGVYLTETSSCINLPVIVNILSKFSLYFQGPIKMSCQVYEFIPNIEGNKRYLSFCFVFLFENL